MEKMQQVLLNAITPQGTDWNSIMAAVKSSGLPPVRNWLTEVRGPLQVLINKKLVARTKDVHHEVYIRLSQTAAITIELKNVAYNERLSEETPNFAADLYLNGQKVGTARNNGTGGQTHVDMPRDLYEMLKAYAQSLPNASKFEPVEALIDDHLHLYLLRRDAASLYKTCVAFLENGKLMRTKKLTIAQAAQARAQFAAKGHKCLTEDEIYEYMVKQSEEQKAAMLASING